jgi:hypothetical protein
MIRECGYVRDTRARSMLFVRTSVAISLGFLVSSCSPEMGEDTSSRSYSVTDAHICPPVGIDTDCGTILTINDRSPIAITFTGQGPYDDVEDTLIGVINNSRSPIQTLGLSSAADICGFDGDGISSARFGIPGNSHDPTGYGGPNAFFTNINATKTACTVNFITPIPPGGTAFFSLEESISTAISCQQIVNNSVTHASTGTTMTAVFKPQVAGMGTTAAAESCGFTRFNWIQKITTLPDPSPFFAVNPTDPANPTQLTSTSTPFNDPVKNGYTSNPAWNSFPFYWDPHTTTQPWSLSKWDNGSTLEFQDAPSDVCLAGGRSFGVKGCERGNAAPGSALSFETHLVGILPDGSPLDLGIGFTWDDSHNGTSGGVSTTATVQPADPGSGTGGFTVTAETKVTSYVYQGLTVTTIDDAPVSHLPPVAVCNSPTVCNAPGLCSANVTNLGASSSDPEGHAISITQSPAGPYSVGQHDVSVSVSNGSLTAQCVAELDVRDCEKPALSCPADFTAECTGNGGAVVTPPGTSATDNCGDPTLHAPAAGRLPLGANALTYTASDASGNVSSCTTTATVQDTIPPSIACPAPTIAECTGARQATVDPGLASASDSCTPPAVTQPGAGTYPLGTTAVNYTASDASANHARCETTVTVRDTTAPSILCPPPTVAECTGNGQVSVDPGSASAQDVCTSVTVNHPGAASYALGQTSVRYTATDEAGNQASCTTSVTVQDTTPPSIACPAPIATECTSPEGAFVQPGQATSSDICTAATVTGPQPGLFPRGTTPVTYTSSDTTGNSASCDSTISVVDTTPPTISVGHPAPLLPANHQYHTVSLDDCHIEIQDTCGGLLSPSTAHAEITCVTSNEPDNGHGDGNTINDIVILDDHTLKLRAERDGGGNGRVYKVHFRVKDQAGNPQNGVCSFVVPHDDHCGTDCQIDDDAVAHSVCRQ